MKLMTVLFISLISFFIKAQPFNETQITPFDGKEYDFFASAVVMSDSFLFVSSAHYNNNTGSVYIYKLENNNYKFIEKIYASDGQEYDLFGAELYYKDSFLFVGSINKRVNALRAGPGAVYIFENKNNHWIEKQIILPPTLSSYGSRFSCSISKCKDYLLIGAEQYNSEVELSGEAFLYKLVNGNYELYQEFKPPNPLRYQEYGSSVLLQENLLLISSLSDSTESGIYSGSVYAYRKDDSLWYYSEKYIPEANSEYLSFGTSLASNDNYIFVGTTANINYYKPGKVYIYNNTDYTVLDLTQVIETGDKYFDDRFGVSLSAKGDSLLVGAIDDTVNNNYPGAAYLFVSEGENWVKKYKITPSDVQGFGDFGSQVILTDNNIIIGDPEANIDSMYYVGKVYIYSSTPLLVNEQNKSPLKQFSLSQNYPNPFNPTTNIGFRIVDFGFVTLKVFDVLGREVAVLVNEEKRLGSYEVEFNASGIPNLASGIYFYRLQSGSYSSTKKMILLK